MLHKKKKKERKEQESISLLHTIYIIHYKIFDSYMLRHHGTSFKNSP